MAIQDQIVIKSDVDPISTLKILTVSMGITDEPYDVKSHPLMPVVGIRGTTWTAHANEIKDPYLSHVKKVVGFVPTVDIAIFLDKKNAREAKFEWLNAVINILAHQTWDLALLHGDSDVVLFRKSGELILRNDNRLWIQKQLDMNNLSYIIADLPNF